MSLTLLFLYYTYRVVINYQQIKEGLWLDSPLLFKLNVISASHTQINPKCRERERVENLRQTLGEIKIWRCQKGFHIFLWRKYTYIQIDGSCRVLLFFIYCVPACQIHNLWWVIGRWWRRGMLFIAFLSLFLKFQISRAAWIPYYCRRGARYQIWGPSFYLKRNFSAKN